MYAFVRVSACTSVHYNNICTYVHTMSYVYTLTITSPASIPKTKSCNTRGMVTKLLLQCCSNEEVHLCTALPITTEDDSLVGHLKNVTNDKLELPQNTNC